MFRPLFGIPADASAERAERLNEMNLVIINADIRACAMAIKLLVAMSVLGAVFAFVAA